MTDAAVDTSAAVPYVLRSHEAHRSVSAHLVGRDVSLTGHSLAETYAVLTRLPGDARVDPADAARLIAENFAATLFLPAEIASTLPSALAPAGIAGGAVYDAMVGLAARAADVPLVTRDSRAAATYTKLDVAVEIVPTD